MHSITANLERIQYTFRKVCSMPSEHFTAGLEKLVHVIHFCIMEREREREREREVAIAFSFNFNKVLNIIHGCQVEINFIPLH